MTQASSLQVGMPVGVSSPPYNLLAMAVLFDWYNHNLSCLFYCNLNLTWTSKEDEMSGSLRSQGESQKVDYYEPNRLLPFFYKVWI